MSDSRKNKIAAISAGAAVVLLAAGAAVYFHKQNVEEPAGTVSETSAAVTQSTFEATSDPDSESPTAERLIVYNGETYRYREDIDTLLIIGTDNFEMEEMSNTHRNNSQADFLLLVVFDNTDKTYKIIQINRDTITAIRKYDVYGQYSGLIDLQIALSHSYGSGGDDSCRDTEFAVSNLLYGSDVDNYMAVTMAAVPIMNDLVGGVDVVIEDNFEGVENSFVMGETVHLTGDQALEFVRSRMSMPDDPTNIGRMSRQRTYMVAFMEALGSAMEADPDFEVHAFSALGDTMISDMTTDRIEELADRFTEYEEEAIIVPEGESVEGDVYMEFYVDEDALQQMVVDTFYEPA